MNEWLRKLPHPYYGNYGGANNTCSGDGCPPPIDRMDLAFRRHDICLKKNPENKRECDERLRAELDEISLNELKFPIYGTLYLCACKLLF